MVRFSCLFICGLLIAVNQVRTFGADQTSGSANSGPRQVASPAIRPTAYKKDDATKSAPKPKKNDSIPKKQLRVTLIQYDCSSNKQDSVARLLELVAKSAPASDLIVLGETVFAPYTTCKHFSDVAESIPGPFTESLSKLARQNKVHICSGIVEKDGDKLFNTAVLIGPDGRILSKYRKTSLTTIDERQFQPGDGPTVVETELGRIGMLICKDSQDLEVISSIARQNPQIILVPSYGLAKTDYTTKQEINCMVDECIDEWRVRMQTLAKLCHAFVLRADHVGMEDQQVRVGHSIAVSPGGYVIAEATMKPACLDVVVKADSPDQKHW